MFRLIDCPKIVLKDSKKSNIRFVCSLILPPAKFANSLDPDCKTVSDFFFRDVYACISMCTYFTIFLFTGLIPV